MSVRRFVVRQDSEGRWTFGREDAPFAAFDSKEAAVLTAGRFVSQHPNNCELVIESDQSVDEGVARA